MVWVEVDETKKLFVDGLGGGGEQNNSAKIDWVELDQQNNFSATQFFSAGWTF